MKISSLPSGYKLTPRFSRPAHIKNDIYHLYTSEKYVVEIIFHSAMFYAPEFYKVSVNSKSGEQIWSGGETLFLDSLFRTDFVSDRYDRMVLTRVNSTESANHMQVICVDLKTGKEEVLTEEGHYHLAGHFTSFDGIYYYSKIGVECIHYGDNSRFILEEILNTHFTEIQTWGTCSIKDCILVITREQGKNIHLFDLIKQQIKDSVTLHWETADSVYVSIGNGEQPTNTIVSVSYSDRQPSGALKHRGSEHYILEYS